MSEAAHSIMPHESTTRLALFLGLGVVGAYLVYKLFQVGAPIAQAASTAVNASTTAAADFWVGLNSALGYGGTVATPFPIVLPDGSIGSTTAITWKYDNQGNAYMQWTDGHIYEWSPRNSAGQYTLTQVA